MLLDLLEMLGLGGQVVLAATVGVMAWYLMKALRIGRAIGSIMASAIRTGAAIAAFLAVGIVLGWIDLSVVAIFGDLKHGATIAWDAATTWGADLLSGVLK